MWVLVGDIGGSNIRLTACEVQGRKKVVLSHPFSCETASVRTLSEVVNVYLRRHPELFFEKGVFAVAAPTNGTHASLTNADWQANVHNLPFPSRLLNDLEAAGWGVLQKGLSKKVLWMGSSLAEELESSLLGVGTGLGLAHCFPNNALVSATEFGHVSFAPFDGLTLDLWTWWRERTGRRLTIEDVCSGRGLQNLVEFCIHKGIEQPVEWGHQEDMQVDWGERLSESAGSPFATAVWNLFFGILGAVCGDVIVGNRSQYLFLCGGVVEKNVDLFAVHQETFEKAMKDKAPMTHLVEEASVMLFTESKLQQYGCGIWYAHQQER